MDYMSKHGTRRTRPAELIPGAVRVLSARMNYWPPDSRPAGEALADQEAAYVSRYALGRDYHKVLRGALQGLADDIGAHLRALELGGMGYRVFVCSLCGGCGQEFRIVMQFLCRRTSPLAIARKP